MGDTAGCDFLKMLWHEHSGRECKRALFLVGANPRCGKHIIKKRTVGIRERFKVEVRCPTGEGDRSIGRDTHELEALGNYLPVAGLDFVGEEE